MSNFIIGRNCTLKLGKQTTLQTRRLTCHGTIFLFGLIQTVAVESTGNIRGTGVLMHSFSSTSIEFRATIHPCVMQINLDVFSSRLYHPAFEEAMRRHFCKLGPLAVFAMGMPFILLQPEIEKFTDT